MLIKLPQIIAAFVQAKNDHDSDAVIVCFASNAVVLDEGQEIRGTTDIKKWIDTTSEKYQDTLEATDLVEQGKEIVLTAQVSGNFEGSPVSLDFHFTITNDKITRLSIQFTGE